MTLPMENPLSRYRQDVDARAPVAQFLSERFSQLADEIEAWRSVEVDAAVAAAGFQARRAANEEMNQMLRRLRQCQSTEEVAAWLVDSTSPYSSQAALFEITSTTLRGVRTRGFSLDQDSFHELEVPLERAPAFAHSAQERDTVVAIGSPGEVSAEVLAALGHRPDEKVYLYPVVIEEETVAILYATATGAPGHQFVDGAALELLTQAAAGAARILASSPTPEIGADSELVKIKGVEMQPRSAVSVAILKQAREARARWYARVAVASIRLRRQRALESGRMQRDIYKALRPDIDSARRTYAQDFLAVSPGIADYLHKELLSLAHDDASLLGPDYPGSLV